jgi:hypothetical protein
MSSIFDRDISLQGSSAPPAHCCLRVDASVVPAQPHMLAPDDEQDYTLIVLLSDARKQSGTCVEPGCRASGAAGGSALTLTNPGID